MSKDVSGAFRRSSDPIDRNNAYWRQDDHDHHTLIADGRPLVVLNHDTHSMTLMPDRDPTTVPIPHRKPLFAEAEERFGGPALPIRALPDARFDAREADRAHAQTIRDKTAARHDSRQFIRQSIEHLDKRSTQAPLSSLADTAYTFMRMTLRELEIHNGNWTDAAFSHNREAGKAFNDLPANAHTLEQLARLEHGRAQKSIRHARSINDLPDGALKEMELFEQEQRERGQREK